MGGYFFVEYQGQCNGFSIFMKHLSSNSCCLRSSTLILATVLTLFTYGCGKISAPTEPQTNDGSSTHSTEVSPATAAEKEMAPIESPQEPANEAVENPGAPIEVKANNEPLRESKQKSEEDAIANGYYAMGGTDQGLEVRGNQYRYYDEGGEHEWRSISQLTSVGADHVFDGENYWCHSASVPEGGGICTANGWQAYGSVGKVAPSELALGGVETGASEAEVIARLGQPDQLDRTSPFSTQFTYRGLSVSFFEDAALTIRSVSPNYCTPSGVCVGMAVSEVERIYGAPLVNDREDGQYLEYHVREVACAMELEIADDEVGAIGLVCQI
jgi:hypothetical protein